VIGAVAILSACGGGEDNLSDRAAEAIAERSTDADIDTNGDDGSLSVETEDGSFAANLGKLPDGWPSDIALPEDIEVLTGGAVDSPEGRILTVQATTAVEPLQVIDNMRAAMPDWTVSDETELNGSGVLQAGARFELDDRELTVGATGSDGEFQLSLNYIAPG
jgi:hypothetical protein